MRLGGGKWWHQSDTTMESLCYALVDSNEIFKRTQRRTPGVEEVMVSLVELHKRPKVVGHTIFKKTGDIPRIEEVKVKYFKTRSVVRFKGKE